VEWLERRLVLSSVSWKNPNGGDWDTAANWSGGEVPTAADDVTIGIAVSNPITHNTSATDSVHSVTSADPIVLFSGSLSIAAASTFSSDVTLSGGTLGGGPVTFTGGATLVGTANHGNGTGGTLSGVTLDGTLDLATNGGANVTITGGLTLSGTIDIGNAAGSTQGALDFQGAQTFGGTGTVVFGGSTGYPGNQISTASSGGDSGTLTIGPGITIKGQNGNIGWNRNNNGVFTPLVNQGTIDADVSGGAIQIYGANLTNSGTLQATGGSSLYLNLGWTNSGSITADASNLYFGGIWSDTGPITVNSGSSLVLQGSFNPGAGANIGGNGGTVYVEGAVTNNGSTVTLDDPSLTYLLHGGTVTGGTVSLTNSVTLFGTDFGGTLSGVTLDGTLDLATNTQTRVSVTGGLTLNGTIDIGNAAGKTEGVLDFVGAQTFGGSGTVVFGSASAYPGNQINTASSGGDSGTLTIGPGITIQGQNGNIGWNNNNNRIFTPLVIQGTITAAVSGDTIQIYSSNGSNSGTLQVKSGASLDLNGGWTNSAPITASGGSSLALNGTWSNSSAMTADASTVFLEGTWSDTGPIGVDNGSSLYLEGSFNPGVGADIGGSGGSVYLEGTVNNSGSTLTLDDPSLMYLLAGGTVTGGTVALTGGTTLVGTAQHGFGTGGTLARVTLSGTLDLATYNAANVAITNGLTLNGTIDIGNAAGSTQGALDFEGAQTFGGTGTVLFGGSTGYPGNQISTASSGGDSGTLTIGPGITIEGQNGNIGWNRNKNGIFTPLVNQGTIHADMSGGAIQIYGANFTNSGTLQATGGGSLSLNVGWTNSGSITADASNLYFNGIWSDTGPIAINHGSALYLEGSFNSGVGTDIGGSGSTVYLEGTVNNQGSTLTLGDPSLRYVLQGGTVSGGTVSLINGVTLIGSPLGATLSGVTLDGTLDLATNNQARVNVTGGLTLSGTMYIGNAAGSSQGVLNFVGAQTLGGSGTILFGAFSDNQINTAASGGDSGTLTIGPEIEIRGQSGRIGYDPTTSGIFTPLVNQGVISADFSGETISVYGTNWTNSGTLQANGGTLKQYGNLTNSGSITADGAAFFVEGGLTTTGPVTINDAGSAVIQGAFRMDYGGSLGGNGGTVDFQGTVVNQGATLTLDDASLAYRLDGATITGGTVALKSGATLLGEYDFDNGGTLSGVTFDGILDLATNNGANVIITGGLTLNGTIDLGNAGGTTLGRLHFRGAQTLSGSGSILFGGNSGNQITTATSNSDSGTLTIGPSITLRGKNGSIGNSTLALINEGTIAADVSSGRLTISASSLNNSGTIEAKSGGALSAGGGTFSNTGTVEVQSGSMTISSTVSQVSGKVLTGGNWVVLANSTLTLSVAGTITTSQADVTLGGGGATFTNLSGLAENDGTLSFLNGATFKTAADLLNTGVLTVGAGSVLTISGSFTQAGSGGLGFQVGGSPASGLFGQMNSTGAAALGGTLDVSLVNGFGPVRGQDFPVMSFSSESGGFAQIGGLNIGRFMLFNAALGATSLVLQTLVDSTDPADSTISIPQGGAPGQDVTISYTVADLNAAPALGDWYDSLYLSAGPTFGTDAILIGRVAHAGDVAGHTSYSGTLTAPLPAANEGSYHVVLVADSRGLVPDVNRVNNVLVSADQIQLSVPVLTPGSPVSGTIQSGQDIYYRLDAQAGHNYQIAASLNAAIEADLDVRYQDMPEPSNFDQTSSNPGGVQQQITLTHTQAGPYYILLHGTAGAGSGQGFSLMATDVADVLNSVSPNLGSNYGQVTTALTGAGFSPQAKVSLVSAGVTLTTASSVLWKDSSTLWATFNLVGVPAGAYDVQVSEFGVSTTDPGAFTVVSSSLTGSAVFHISSPAIIRGQSAVTIDYANEGYTDAPAPLMDLQAKGSLFPVWAFCCGGVTTQGGYSLQTMEILGINQDGPAGILPPFYHGTMTVDFSPTQFSAGFTSTFTLSVLQSASTSIDWASQWSSLKPDGVPTEAWNAILPNFTALVGSTEGGFQTALDTAATQLSLLGISTSDISRLFGFLVQQASDLLPAPTLGAAVDGAAPAPGMPLTFGRVFVQSIDGRYQPGPLGLGWQDTWDLQAITNSAGDVTILGRGESRFFSLHSNKTYQDQPGDYATLTLQDGAYQLRESDGTLYVFDTSGRLSYEEDPNGNRISATYSNDLLTELTDSAGESFTFAYNAQGVISRLTDEAGRVTTYSYDASGQHLMSVSGPDGTTRYSYDTYSNPESANALLSITNPDGTQLDYAYDSEGRMIGQQLNSGAEAVTYSYPSFGGLTITDASGATTTILRDDQGDLRDVFDPLGRVTQYIYDANNNLVEEIDPAGDTSTFAYDSQGNVIEPVDPLGNITRMTYNLSFDDITSLTDARGNTTKYGYDSQGNLLSITYPNGTQQQFTYDPLGNVTESTEQNGDVIGYTYNAQGLVTQKDFADGTHVDFTYDERGNMLTTTDSSGTITMEYDSGDHLTEISYPSGLSLRFTYDSGGRRIRMVDQLGFRVNYAYDAAGRLAGLTDGSGNPIVAYTYDGVGRLIQKDMGNGTRTVYTYDADGEVLSITNYAPDQVTINSFDDYTYDPLGNVLTDANQDGQWTYTYDADSQLIHAVFTPNGSDPDGLTAQDLRYVYDAVGNRVSTTENGVTTNYTTNTMNQYTQVGSASYAFDANGNLVAETDGNQTWTYKYNGENRLTSAVTPAGTSTYQYDAFGHLVASMNNGQLTQYQIDPAGLGNVVSEFDGSGNLIAHYTYGLGLTSRVAASGAAAYYDFNAIGSTVGVTGSAGTYANTYSYLPYGGTQSATETISNPFGFIGQSGVMDSRNGLDYMRARFYAISDGRFTSEDPIGLAGGQVNLYGYARENPASLNDPSGLLSHSDQERLMVGMYYVHIIELLAKETIIELLIAIGPTAEAMEVGFGLTITEPEFYALIAELEFVMLTTEYILYHRHIELKEYYDDLKIEWKALQNIHSGFPASHDPNFLAGPAGYGPSGFVTQDQTLPYAIDFENDPTATGSAQMVRITQQLDSNLDWSTFQLGEFSFAGYSVQVPPGRTEYSTRIDARDTLGLFVDVTGGIDLLTGLATWTFTTIDPATLDLPSTPFVGFLPPDTNPPEGEGFVMYSVKPKATDPTGTVVNAQASVVFDTNPAMLTEPVFNTIDAGAPTSSVTPLPAATSSLSFPVSWSGSDDPGGSGIATYTIYVSADNGPFQPWIVDTTQTRAVYTAQSGSHTYAFSSQATDNVGHVEPPHATADTTILVVTTPPQVVNTLVSGSGWTMTYLNSLKASGLGDGTGYAIPVGSPSQLTTLPWTNLNQVEIIFSEAVKVQQSDLAVYGVNTAHYSVSGFSYNPATFAATWTLATPLSDDKLLLDLSAHSATAVTNLGGGPLDGAWTNGASHYPSGNGQPGTDFLFRINLLPGDVDGNGGVNLTDYLLVRSKLGLSASSPGYNFRYDVLGQGTITTAEANLVRALIGSVLPGGNSGAGAGGGMSAGGGQAPSGGGTSAGSTGAGSLDVQSQTVIPTRTTASSASTATAPDSLVGEVLGALVDDDFRSPADDLLVHELAFEQCERQAK
jgi:RHS repeat-associated protein